MLSGALHRRVLVRRAPCLRFSSRDREVEEVFSFHGAGRRLRLITAGAGVHACYWIGFINFGAVQAPDVSAFSMADPLWGLAGVGLSLAAVGACQIYASQVVGRVTLDRQAGVLNVHRHSFMGNIQEQGCRLLPTDVECHRESKDMLTILPKNARLHLVLDKTDGKLHDRESLIEFLENRMNPVQDGMELSELSHDPVTRKPISRGKRKGKGRR